MMSFAPESPEVMRALATAGLPKSVEQWNDRFDRFSTNAHALLGLSEVAANHLMTDPDNPLPGLGSVPPFKLGAGIFVNRLLFVLSSEHDIIGPKIYPDSDFLDHQINRYVGLLDSLEKIGANTVPVQEFRDFFDNEGVAINRPVHLAVGKTTFSGLTVEPSKIDIENHFRVMLIPDAPITRVQQNPDGSLGSHMPVPSRFQFSILHPSCVVINTLEGLGIKPKQTIAAKA
jgi:hypothetical protein